MDSYPDRLDCKISIRKYLLVTQPTRWSQQGARVVVHSPMINIGPLVTSVPVKCHRGPFQNDVDFLPKTDIEKDTKEIYEKSYVSKTPSSDYAHGVAAFESCATDDFEYKRGQRFWLSIESNTTSCIETVRVINLDTFQRGSIRIDQVCWLPTIRGPGQEIWTLGGALRDLKLCGSRNYKYMSWVICQYTDGRPANTKIVEIPKDDDLSAGPSRLSLQESQALFDAQCKVMEAVAQRSFPLTPPATPEPRLPPALRVNTDLYRRLRRIAQEARKRNGAPYVLRTSTISTRRPKLQARHEAIRATLGVQSNWDGLYDDPSCNEPSQADSREPSPSSPVPSRTESGFHGADVYLGASWMCDMIRNEHSSVMSLTNPATRIPIRHWEHWREHRHNVDVLLEGLCDLNLLDCPYTIKSTTKHFHCPPEKCPASFHDHCVSKLKPYPLDSHCLLANSPISYPNHKCCQWSAVDMDGATLAVQKEEHFKVREARRNRFDLLDMSSLVDCAPKCNSNVINSGVLDPAGEILHKSLEDGSLDDEVSELTPFECNAEDVRESPFEDSGCEMEWSAEWVLVRR